MTDRHYKNNDKPRILMVEDNEDYTELVKLAFDENKFEGVIDNVYDGEEALNYLYHLGKYQDEKTRVKPDIILLDLRLPKIDGLDVLNEIKSDRKLSTIPVVVLTSSEADRDISMSYKYHANGYIVKPELFPNMVALVKDFLAYWTHWMRLP